MTPEQEQKQLNLRSRMMHFILQELKLSPSETIAMLSDTLGHVIFNVVDGHREASLEVLEEINKMLQKSFNRICDQKETNDHNSRTLRRDQ